MKTFFRNITILCLFVSIVSCVSTKSTLKNVDDKAPSPKLTPQNTFVLTEVSKDPKYGYDPDYPVNVFYRNTKDENLNAERFLNALAGPNGETISYIKMESCCPFPSKHTEMGAGFLDIYEVTWNGQSTPIKLYINIYEKGYLFAPKGFSIKK